MRDDIRPIWKLLCNVFLCKRHHVNIVYEEIQVLQVSRMPHIYAVLFCTLAVF